MTTYTIEMNPEEDRVLREFLNVALKAVGGDAAKSYLHFIAKLDEGRQHAQDPNQEEKKAPSNSDAAAVLN